MTLNLAQLLCVLQREENWSGERIARRAQPAGSPAGIKASAPPPRRARPAESSAKESPAAPARSAGCKGGIKTKGENGARKRGTEQWGGGEKVGKEDNLRSGGSEEIKEVRFWMCNTALLTTSL